MDSLKSLANDIAGAVSSLMLLTAIYLLWEGKPDVSLACCAISGVLWLVFASNRLYDKLEELTEFLTSEGP